MPDTPEQRDAILYPTIIRRVRETAWAIRPETLAVITDLLAFRAHGGRLSREEIRARIGAASGAQVGAARSGSVAVIPLHGVIVNRADMFDEVSGAASLDRFRARFREALSDDSVGSILLHVDSPGGAVDGVPETADEIMAARGRKPITAIADTVAASAAYWIASAADELVVTPSGEAGSIGVYAAHADLSKAHEMLGVKMTLLHYGENKVLGNPFEPLSEAAREAIQSRVDDYGRMFDAAVARQRGVKVSDVRERFGQGLVFGAKESVSRGMADRVATFEETLQRMRSPRRSSPKRSARHAFAFI
ncbi:MAG: S49 family peptidase [Burkholderiales bacterium]|nr:S49 family peptidase [Burkholderiales bacterium]